MDETKYKRNGGGMPMQKKRDPINLVQEADYGKTA